jgi:sulfur-oxidizing protein SoxA
MALRPAPATIAAILLAAVAAASIVQTAAEPPKQSGTELLSPALREQQADDGANPGMLWVERGARLWSTAPAPETKACSACHGGAESMRGVATRYPAVELATGALVNLELRVNRCRTEHQRRPAFAYESEDLLALTAFVAHQSRGLPIATDADAAAASHYERGRRLFELRQGQLDLACSQCHVDNAGRRLRGDTISQAHPTGYPIYRLEWQGLGSLHRRLRTCAAGVRAEAPEPGSADHLALELYLAVRARGLAIETPAIRR